MTNRIVKGDGILLSIVMLLLGFGIVSVYSSSFAIAQMKFTGADFFLTRHSVKVILSLFCFFLFANIDYHTLGRWSTLLYLCGLLLLVYVLVAPQARVINGAKRWVDLSMFSFQVSDFARIALIVLLSHQCQKFKDRMHETRIFIQQIVKIAAVCALIMVEPNFSTALLVFCIGVAMLFIGGSRLVHILAFLGLCIPGLVLVMMRTAYRRHRIEGFFDLNSKMEGINYQVCQSLIGLGHGGPFGVGLGQGEQKYFFLPEPHTDFVFSVIGEEIGFIGLMVLLIVFFIMIYRGMRIAGRAPDVEGRVMAFGVTFMVALYFILHVGVNIGLFPTTGIPLPFLSYGGMSLLFTMIGIGILFNISSHSNGEYSLER